jgi:hypothetical protein
MRRWEAWWNHLAVAAVSLSGLAYGIFKYFVPSPDPDSRAGHPWQPVLLKAHVLAAPLAVFGVGLLLRRHALRKLRHGEKEGRTSGALIVWIFAPLVLTGYLVQVLAGFHGARVAGWSHAGLGVIVLLAYVFHPKRQASGIASRSAESIIEE